MPPVSPRTPAPREQHAFTHYTKFILINTLPQRGHLMSISPWVGPCRTTSWLLSCHQGRGGHPPRAPVRDCQPSDSGSPLYTHALVTYDIQHGGWTRGSLQPFKCPKHEISHALARWATPLPKAACHLGTTPPPPRRSDQLVMSAICLFIGQLHPLIPTPRPGRRVWPARATFRPGP